MCGPTWRADRKRFQFRCYPKAAHSSEITRSCTLNSMFYRKRCDIRITLKVIFRLTLQQDRFSQIYRDLSIHYRTIGQLYRDLVVLFESDVLYHDPIVLGKIIIN
jgi:hypothetical protein